MNTIRLYHRTSRVAADAILTSWPHRWQSAENTDEVYFSTEPHGEAVGYGDVTLCVNVLAYQAQLDDEFPSGEQHYRVKASDLQTYYVSEWTP